MAKKAKQESQSDQSERFRKAVEELEAAGGLSPTEAAERFDQLLSLAVVKRPTPELKDQ